MDKLIQDGVLGIVTGILTTVFLYLIKILFDTKVTPYLREIRYQGIDISGTWTGKTDDAENQQSTAATLFLSQSARELGGTFHLKHSSPDNNFEINFNVVGCIWEGYVTLNFTPIDKRITSYATSLLKIAGGGIALDGQICFRNVKEECVSAEKITLTRATT